MTGDNSSFDDAYRDTFDYFGGEPEKILVDFVQTVDRDRPALDVGAGQGRNTIFLVGHGIDVHAIDPSHEACAAASAAACDRGLTVRVVQAGFESFDPAVVDPAFRSYGAICLFGLIQTLRWDKIELLRSRVESWSSAGTVVFLTAWTVDDPSYASCSGDWRPAGRHSFSDGGGTVRTFLDPGEGPRLFEDFEVVHHWEGMGPAHRHGDGPLQRHGNVELVLRR
jgi:SAM-dependent methyltransferase